MGKSYSINSFINCNSTHAIYLLKYPCGLVYIGQTKRQLTMRISEHKTAIRNKNSTWQPTMDLQIHKNLVFVCGTYAYKNNTF